MDHFNPYKSPSAPTPDDKQRNLPPFQITVEGEPSFTANTLGNLLSEAAQAATRMRPDIDRRIQVKITAVRRGSTLMRWVSFNIYGRPQIGIDVRMLEAGEVIASFESTNTTFFLEKKDLHYGGFFEGTNRVFLATACRKSARTIVERAIHSFALPTPDRTQLMRSLHDEPMLIYMLGGVILVSITAFVKFWDARFTDEAVLASLILGCLFGIILGYIVGRLANWARRLAFGKQATRGEERS